PSLTTYFRDTSLLPAPSSAAGPPVPGPSALRPNGHGLPGGCPTARGPVDPAPSPLLAGGRDRLESGGGCDDGDRRRTDPGPSIGERDSASAAAVPVHAAAMDRRPDAELRDRERPPLHGAGVAGVRRPSSWPRDGR